MMALCVALHWLPLTQHTRLIPPCAQGMLFAATSTSPDRVLQPELLELEQLYGSARAHVPVGELLAAKHAQWQHDGLEPQMAALMEQITELGQQYGQGHTGARLF